MQDAPVNGIQESTATDDVREMIQAADQYPGVAEAVALMESISALIPQQPVQLTVTRYATGGNIPNADLG